jgi:type II secretory pathway component PulM
MSWRSLSVRDRRALALGVVAFAPMLLWLLVAAPFVRRLNDTHHRLERSGEMLRRELQIVRSGRQYAAARAEVQRRLDDSQQRLIYATSDASARATLVGVVDERARASNIDVLSVDATADSTSVGTLRRVSVRLSGVGDMEGILTLIGALEGGSPFLAVTQLEIETSGPSASTDYAAVPTGGDSTVARPPVAKGPESLALRLVVSGFRATSDAERRSTTTSNRMASR